MESFGVEASVISIVHMERQLLLYSLYDRNNGRGRGREYVISSVLLTLLLVIHNGRKRYSVIFKDITYTASLILACQGSLVIATCFTPMFIIFLVQLYKIREITYLLGFFYASMP